MTKSRKIVNLFLDELGIKNRTIVAQKDSKNGKFLILSVRIENGIKEVKISYKELFLKSCEF